MNHYQKLAALALRLIALAMIIIGMISLLFLPSSLNATHAPSSIVEWQFLSDIIIAVFGLVLYVFSPLLGRLIGKGL